MKGYFDDLCASKESQLYGTLDVTEDNEKVQELRLALKADPDSGELYMKLGNALAYQLRYIEAISAYTKAIDRMPDNIEGYQKRGGRYLTTLQLERAYADFTRCGSFEENAEIDLLSGLTAYMLEKYDEAKDHFDTWISLAGDDTEELVAVIYWYTLCCVKVHDEEAMRNVLAMYSPDMYIGHHTSYQCGIELFRGGITSEEAMEKAEAVGGEARDLEYSMIVYAVAIHAYMLGNAGNYHRYLDKILMRDTFWAGFASLAALHDRHPEVARNAAKRGDTAAAAEALNSYFEKKPKVALAFSGGTDSSLVLYAARKAGCDIRPYFVKSQFQPQFELDDVQRLCGQIGIELSILSIDILLDPEVVSNPHDRCYHCKKHVFGLITRAAARDGYPLIVDGTNASDEEGDRPGMIALREYSVRSPLAECGITKAQVREISRTYGLFTADKPAYACLATRIPKGRVITDKLLTRIERSENTLFAMGFSDFRVRVIGDAARLQMPEAQLGEAFARREQIRSALQDEFSAVLLDLATR